LRFFSVWSVSSVGIPEFSVETSGYPPITPKDLPTEYTDSTDSLWR
jgi:hypothetical protein